MGEVGAVACGRAGVRRAEKIFGERERESAFLYQQSRSSHCDKVFASRTGSHANTDNEATRIGARKYSFKSELVMGVLRPGNI